MVSLASWTRGLFSSAMVENPPLLLENPLLLEWPPAARSDWGGYFSQIYEDKIFHHIFPAPSSESCQRMEWGQPMLGFNPKSGSTMHLIQVIQFTQVARSRHKSQDRLLTSLVSELLLKSRPCMVTTKSNNNLFLFCSANQNQMDRTTGRTWSCWPHWPSQAFSQPFYWLLIPCPGPLCNGNTTITAKYNINL